MKTFVWLLLYLSLELCGECVEDLCLLMRIKTVNEDMQKRKSIQAIPAIKCSLNKLWGSGGGEIGEIQLFAGNRFMIAWKRCFYSFSMMDDADAELDFLLPSV